MYETQHSVKALEENYTIIQLKYIFFLIDIYYVLKISMVHSKFILFLDVSYNLNSQS